MLNICKPAVAVLLTLLFSSAKPQGLQKGTNLSHLKFGNVINYKSDSLKLKDFKGKLVIFDFWGFTCLSCLHSFPKLDSLQSMFRDKIQIILVNHDSKDSTLDFFRQRPKLKKPGLPMITGDNYLNKLFPHQGVPFHVWIDSAGKFIIRAYGYNTTESTVSAHLNGRPINLPDADTTYRPVHSFVDPQWETSLSYCSYITKCIPGIDYGPTNNVSGVFQIQRKCASIVELYQQAFRGVLNVDYSYPWQFVLEINDDEKYIRPKTSDPENYNRWESENSYNYHLLWPEERRSEAFEIMKSDLDRYFNIESQMQQKFVRSLVLVRTSNKDKLKSNGGKTINTLIPADEKSIRIDSVRYFTNQPYSELSIRLKLFVERKLSMPFVDSTAFEGNIDFKMRGNVLDSLTLDNLNEELARYDLRLEIKDVKMGVMVLRKKLFADKNKARFKPSAATFSMDN